MLTDYLSVGEAAQRSGVAYHTLMARIRSGKVPATKHNHVYFIHKDEVVKIQPPDEAASRARNP